MSKKTLQQKVNEAMDFVVEVEIEKPPSPGPWKLGEGEQKGLILDVNGQEVVSDEEHGSMVAFNSEADGCLLAASWDLLQALKIAKNALLPHLLVPEAKSQRMQMINAAIKKATFIVK